jgi:hypothetical protein
MALANGLVQLDANTEGHLQVGFMGAGVPFSKKNIDKHPTGRRCNLAQGDACSGRGPKPIFRWQNGAAAPAALSPHIS